MNKKQKIVSTTLSTVTALSSVGAISSLPNTVIKNVQALNENTVETTQQVQPTVRTDLEKEVEDKNSTVISTGAALQGAENQKNSSEEAFNNAKTNKKENDEKLTTSQNQVDQTLAKEVKDRAQVVLQLQETLSSQKQQKEALDKAVEEKQNQLKDAQNKYNKAQANYNDLANKNKDALDKLNRAEEDKAQYEKNLASLNDQLTTLNKDIETVTTRLNEEKKSLENNKTTLSQLTTEKQKLESQLKNSNDKLNSLKDALNKQPTTEEVIQLQKDIDALEKDIDTKTTQLSTLDQEINSLTTSIEAQTATVNETTKKKDDLTKQYDALTTQVNEAKTNLDTAKTKYDAAKKTLDDLNNNVDTPELANLKFELNHLQSEQTALQAQVDATTSQLKAAETELANAYTKYDNNVVNFYKEVYNNTGNLDAYYAYTELEKYDGKTVGSATIYDSKNYDKTMASLSDLKEALNYIKMCNQIRAYEGVAPLKVSYYLMSVSAIQNQYSSVNLGHSKLYEVGENLYWSSQDNNSEDFLDKNGNLDVKSLYELGKKPDSFNVQSNNPFYGWWTEEKILYEQTHNIDKAGHYFNIVDKNYTLTGFSHNNQKHNLNMYTWGQVFKDSLKLNNLNGEGQTTITGLTVDEFENTLNSWILKKANGVQIEQDKVDAAKAELEQALKDANADVDRITALIDENDKKIKALESEINANQQNINAYNAELNTLNSEVTSKEAEKDALSANIDMLNTAINAYNKQLEECNKAKDALDAAKNNLDNVHAEYDQAVKGQKAQADVVADTTKKLDNANESLAKAQRATADWEDIKAGTIDHYAPYHDEVLDNLSDTVLVYVSAKDAAGSIETKLADAQKDYDEKTKNYEDALNAYNAALNEYNDAKADLDAFDAKYGIVTKDTITLPSEMTYTGKQIKPEVVVKDSKGNVVDPSEYTITYGDNTGVGEGSVTIKLSDEYYVGTITKTFKIVLASTNKDDNTTPPADKKDDVTTTPTDKKDNITVTPTQKNDTTVKSDKTSTIVKTGDSSAIVIFSLLSMLSMFFYTLLRRKENKE